MHFATVIKGIVFSATIIDFNAGFWQLISLGNENVSNELGVLSVTTERLLFSWVPKMSQNHTIYVSWILRDKSDAKEIRLPSSFATLRSHDSNELV